MNGSNELSHETGESKRGIADRRDFLVKTGSGIASVGIAGCQSVLENQEDNASNRTTSDAEDVPSDLFEGETLTVGNMQPFPSDNVTGIGGKQAGEFAVHEHNQSGGVLGGDLQQIIGDTKISPAKSKQRIRELINRENVDAIMGGFLDTSYNQMMEPIADSGDLVSILAGAGSMNTAKKRDSNYDRYKFSFKSLLALNVGMMGQVYFLEDLVEQLGLERIAIYTEDLSVFDTHGEPLFSAIRERDFVDLPIAKRTSASLIDWNPIFDEVEEADCDLMVVNLVLTGATAARQWGSQERPFLLGGTHLHAMQPTFWEESGGIAPGLFTFNSAGHDSQQTSRTVPFMDRFKEFFGFRSSNYNIYTVYDAFNLWIDAVKNTGSTHPDDIRPYLLDRTWEGSVQQPEQSFTGRNPDSPHEYSHHWKWTGWPSLEGKEGWNAEGWPPFTQWQSEGGKKDTNAEMVTVAPPKNAGGEYNFVWPDWVSIAK